MKKYLKDLETELKKLKISDAEIHEILRDHEEMLTEAQTEGLKDEELVKKFGEPKVIAKQIYTDNFSINFDDVEAIVGEGELDGYTLFKSFPVLEDIKKFAIKLVSEDVMIIPSEESSIEIFAKGLENEEDYQASFVDGEFLLKKHSKNSFKLRLFGKGSSTDFGIKIPVNAIIEELLVETVSGDYEVDKLRAKNLLLKSTSGDFEVSNLLVKGLVKLQTVSGDFECSGVKAEALEISLVSGDIELEHADIEYDIQINTVSGDIEFRDVRCQNINFRSVSGDFDGEEVYPVSVELQSVSGDMEINNDNDEHEIVITRQKSVSGEVNIK